jgi:hypothetical protein
MPRGDQLNHFSNYLWHQQCIANTEAAKALETRQHPLARSGL